MSTGEIAWEGTLVVVALDPVGTTSIDPSPTPKENAFPWKVAPDAE
jgi:hypothetical protein